MLPRYFDGEMVTAYAYLGKRFGRSTQTTAGITFLFIRLLADGIRVLAAAIPLKVILDGLGVELRYFTITAIIVVAGTTGIGWLGEAAEAGKTQIFVFADNPLSGENSFLASLLGGAVFAMASHGSDQLVVQRLLACRSKVEAQKAIIASGV